MKVFTLETATEAIRELLEDRDSLLSITPKMAIFIGGVPEEYLDCECGNKFKKPARGRVPKICRQCRLEREAEIRNRTRKKEK